MRSRNILGIMAPVRWRGRPQPIYPLGLSYALTAAEEAGHEVRAFDCDLRDD